MPAGIDEANLLAFLGSIRLDGAPSDELAGYLERDWRRFLATWNMCRDLKGKCLEIGSSPYFTTALLMEFTRLELTASNYEPSAELRARHIVKWVRPRELNEITHVVDHDLFNVERGPLPYPDDHFDVILFCEVIEHLTQDPAAALAEIRRVLSPGGRLIVTTPNAACLRNVGRMLQGKSVADRYSAYGPYGRHNREYTPAELNTLLENTGFGVDRMFTANVLFRRYTHLMMNFLAELLFSLAAPQRARALGQYTFVTATKRPIDAVRRPDWLYRSYAENEKTIGVADGRAG
ncbi:MAG: methyltransferase domain-containing protein [Novosphingobium sp.]